MKTKNTEQVKKTGFKRIFISAVGLFVLFNFFYFAFKTMFAASVNGQLVSRTAVISELEKQGGKKTLDMLILRTLINQEAKKRNVKISQTEMDSELKKIESSVASQGSTLEDALAQQGMTRENLTDELKLQLMVTKMVGTDIKVTDKEVDDYMKNFTDQSVTRDQVKQELVKQKLNDKIQEFVSGLKKNAKINYFINY